MHQLYVDMYLITQSANLIMDNQTIPLRAK